MRHYALKHARGVKPKASLTLQEERRSAMNSHEDSSSLGTMQASTQATTTNYCGSAPLHFHATSANTERANFRPGTWPRHSSSHVLSSCEGSIDTNVRARGDANECAVFGRRLDHQHRADAFKPIRASLGEGWSAKSTFFCANPPCWPHRSSSRKRSIMAFCSSSHKYRRPLALAVSLQTTRCLFIYTL